MRHRAAAGAIEVRGPEAAGRVDIQFSTYGPGPDGKGDSYGDIVDRGAFTRAIEAHNSGQRPVYLCWSHNWDSLPLGSITSLYDTATGPVASCQFDMEDPEAALVYHKIRKGMIRESSFGFEVGKAYPGADGYQHLAEIWPLFEISPVVVGANRNTQMLNVRGRRFESPLVAQRRLYKELIRAGLWRRGIYVREL